MTTPLILDEGGVYAILVEGGAGDLLAEAATPSLNWRAARTGLPGAAVAACNPTQAGQFLITHGITPVYAGNRLVIPGGAADQDGVQWVNLGVSDVDQPFAMPTGSTAVGRVTLPLSPAGDGADVTVSLCADSGGSPGAVIASTRVPGSWIAQLAAPSGLAAGGPLATAQGNTMMLGAGSSAPWAQPAVSVNGVADYAAPVTSGNYTILLAGYDAIANLAVTSVSTLAYLGGGAVSGPVPQPSVPKAAWFAMACATIDTVVFAGGISGTSYISNAWTASWDPSTGTVGAWTAQAALPTAVVSGGMASSGTTVYVAGGNTANTTASAQSAVWVASAVNGQIQSWAAGPSLPLAVSSPYVAVVNGWLVVAGGVNSAGAVVTSVWYSQIQASGSLGGWAAGPPLPTPAYAYSPGWNLAVTDSAMVIVAGTTTGGGPTFSVQALTVTADGPAPAWQSAQNYLEGGVWQTAAYPGASDGTWEVFNLHLTSYDAIPLVPVPLISVPLPAASLTAGGTYHILCHQDGGDLNDYTALGLDPISLPTAAQTRPNGGGSWTGQPDGYAVIAGVYDQTPGPQVLHLWEDAGSRITSLVYAGASSQILGLCEGTAFEDGTTLAAVTQVAYSSQGLPTGTVQLA